MRKAWDVTIDVAVAPDEAWALVGDPEGVPRWYPLYETCVVEGDTRTLARADGVEMVERLIDRDEARRYYSYGVIAGLPLAHHEASFEVRDAHGGSRIVWHTEAEHDDPDIDMEARLAERQRDALEGLRQVLEALAE